MVGTEAFREATKPQGWHSGAGSGAQMVALQAPGSSAMTVRAPKVAGSSLAVLTPQPRLGHLHSDSQKTAFTRPGGTTSPASRASPRDLKPGRGPARDGVPRLSGPRPPPACPGPGQPRCHSRGLHGGPCDQSPVTRTHTQRVLQRAHTQAVTHPVGLGFALRFLPVPLPAACLLQPKLQPHKCPRRGGLRTETEEGQQPLGGLGRT